MARRPSDRNNPEHTFSDRRGFDPDEFWRDHPHLIRAIRGPHERDASRLPFRRPIAVDDLEDLLETSEDPTPTDEAVVDVRDAPLPVRQWRVPADPVTDRPATPSTSAEQKETGAVIDLTGRLPKRKTPPPVDPGRIPLVKRTPKVPPQPEWLDEIARERLDDEVDGFDAEALRFARRIRRARERTMRPPLTEWNPPSG